MPTLISKIKTMKNKNYLFLLFPPAVLAIVTYIVMWLWNTILTAVVGVHEVNFWQAMGILVLSKILFGGFHGRCGTGPFRKIHKKQMEQEMSGMSEEEKQKLKEIWKKRCFQTDFCKKD